MNMVVQILDVGIVGIDLDGIQQVSLKIHVLVMGDAKEHTRP